MSSIAQSVTRREIRDCVADLDRVVRDLGDIEPSTVNQGARMMLEEAIEAANKATARLEAALRAL